MRRNSPNSNNKGSAVRKREGGEDRQVPQFGWSEGSEAEYNSLQENCLVWSVRFGFNIGDSESSWQGASCCNSLQFVCQA